MREVDAGQTDDEPVMEILDTGAITDAELDAREAHPDEEPPGRAPPPPEPLRCPRCGAALAVGHIVFPSSLETIQTLPISGAWFEGRPPATVLWPVPDQFEHYPLLAYRCAGCGRLEFYARA